jgi:hypothetical protein
MNADNNGQVEQERREDQGVKGIKERIYKRNYFPLNFNSFFPLHKIDMFKNDFSV